jgi:plastocyanin
MPHAADNRRLPIHSRRLLALACLFTLPSGAGDLTLSAQQRDSRPLAGAVLTLAPESGAVAALPPVEAVMDQVDLAFEPDVLVIPLHSSVHFPNSDAISHQVYSFSSARHFQLPLYRGKPYPPVVFDQPGVVTLGCNIHDNMLAYIIVTDAPYFGRTDASGNLRINGVPPGRYRLRLWHPLLNEAPRERVVEAGSADQSITLRLVRGLRPAPVTGRPRSWDY